MTDHATSLAEQLVPPVISTATVSPHSEAWRYAEEIRALKVKGVAEKIQSVVDAACAERDAQLDRWAKALCELWDAKAVTPTNSREVYEAIQEARKRLGRDTPPESGEGK